MKRINIDYISGILENSGCFYAQTARDRKQPTPLFKIVIKKVLVEKRELFEQIIDLLREKYEINFNVWEDDKQVVFQLTSLRSLKNLITFLNENCYLKKKNQKKILEIIDKKFEDKKKRKEKNERNN